MPLWASALSASPLTLLPPIFRTRIRRLGRDAQDRQWSGSSAAASTFDSDGKLVLGGPCCPPVSACCVAMWRLEKVRTASFDRAGRAIVLWCNLARARAPEAGRNACEEGHHGCRVILLTAQRLRLRGRKTMRKLFRCACSHLGAHRGMRRERPWASY